MKEIYMERVIELAQKGLGFVNPGPLVGAVILKNGRLIGEGYLKGYSMKSAEIEAINAAEEDVKSAELFINIEPSKTSIEEIIKKGIKKVYIGMEESNPKNSGVGISALKAAGIEVELGVLEDKCQELNEIYSHYITKRTPFVFTKWAMTLDGKLATRTGDSKWISGEESLKFVHHLRQKVAAIMVGENTVRLDDPLLTTRLEGVEISNPLRIILSKYGDISLDAKVLKVDKSIKTLIICSENIPVNKEKQLLETGVEVLKLKESKGRIDFKDIVKALGEKNIDSLYIEGGSALLGSAFESGIVNKVYAAIAPKIVGGKSAVTPVGGVGIEKMRDAIVLKRVSHEIVGKDVIFKGYIED